MDAFKSMIDKISEGLNFFDFSFFVSGFVTYITLLYFSDEFFLKTIDYTTISGILTSIILSYVCGIVSFIIGKWIRSWIRTLLEQNFCKCLKNKSFDELFKESVDWVKAEKEKQNPVSSNEKLPGLLASSQNKSTAYSAMWIEISKLDEQGVYYRPLYRQWVMQAVCEGLMFSFLFIFTLSIVSFFVVGFTFLYVFSSILAIVSFVACCHEARRYAENQIKEVIISYWSLKKCKHSN